MESVVCIVLARILKVGAQNGVYVLEVLRSNRQVELVG